MDDDALNNNENLDDEIDESAKDNSESVNNEYSDFDSKVNDSFADYIALDPIDAENIDSVNTDVENTDSECLDEEDAASDYADEDTDSEEKPKSNPRPFGITYIALSPTALVNYHYPVQDNSNNGKNPANYRVNESGSLNKQITGTPNGASAHKNEFHSPRELTSLDENFMEYFHRQLENIDSVDDALGEIDTGYDFKDEGDKLDS